MKCIASLWLLRNWRLPIFTSESFYAFCSKRPFLGKWVPFDKARASLYLKKCLFPSKSGDRHSLFLLKVPPKMKASKMCRVRVFFWVRNGHHHHFRNVMTSLYGYEVFPFFSHLRSIWSSLLIEAFACKRKKWSTFPSCHLFKAPFSAFFRRK